jgi:hypothetical protein
LYSLVKYIDDYWTVSIVHLCLMTNLISHPYSTKSRLVIMPAYASICISQSLCISLLMFQAYDSSFLWVISRNFCYECRESTLLSVYPLIPDHSFPFSIQSVHSASWVKLWRYLKEKVAASVKKTEITAVGIPSHWLLVTIYPQMLALTSLAIGGRSVGIVRSRTHATEFVLLLIQSVSYEMKVGYQFFAELLVIFNYHFF